MSSIKGSRSQTTCARADRYAYSGCHGIAAYFSDVSSKDSIVDSVEHEDYGEIKSRLIQKSASLDQSGKVVQLISPKQDCLQLARRRIVR